VDDATTYNKWLSRGILKMDTEDFLMASKYFCKASLRFPDNKDAYCLNVISIVSSYSLAMSKNYIDEQFKREKVAQTLDFLDVAIAATSHDTRDPSLYFFRGLINFQLHKFYDALNDFNVAISVEEDPTG
jgi:tetratricopeptide (TPR) repeat protein